MDCSPPTRLPCPLLSPRVCSDSHPRSQWCYLTISSSVTLCSFCLQSFPASGSFPMSWLCTSGGPSVGVSVSASFLPMHNITIVVLKSDIRQCLNKQMKISCLLLPICNNILGKPFQILCCSRDSQKSSPIPQFERINYSVLSLLYGPALTSVHDYWKNHSFD